MATNDMQSSINGLGAAGEAYPWSFTFRAAQARQLYEIARKHPGAVVIAVDSLRWAASVDPASAELASMLLGAQLALGRCDDAAITARALIRLAPGSEIAKRLASTPCTAT